MGDAFLLPIPKPDDHHLFFVVSPVSDGEALMVNVITVRPSVTDRTVVLEPGDHPFIRKPSAVNYDQAFVSKVSRISAAIRAGDRRVLRQPPISLKLVEKIQRGFYGSPNAQSAHRRFLRDFINFDPDPKK